MHGQKGEKKMTNQQAINLLKVLEQSLDGYCELNDEGKTAFHMAIEALEVFGNSEQLPSAQHESIKCKDCGYAEERGCALFCGFWTRYTAHKGYCFKAEKREE